MGAGKGRGRGGPIGTAALSDGRAVRAAPEAPGRIGSALLIMKPGIALGVALSGFAGMVLARRGVPPAGILLPGLGSIVAAASGAAILNGVFDGAIDARMARLSRRVAALERVGPRSAAAAALSLVLGGLFLAFRYLNPLTGLLVLAAVLSYAFLYTLWLKRRSPYGTVPGGVPGALPVLVGYAAVEGRVGLDGVILFVLMLLWQPPHFWALALKCREDYRAAGLPALPVVRGEPYTKTVIFIYAVALLPLSLALWIFGACSALYAAASAVLWGGFMIALYRNAVLSRRYGRAFGASILYIMGILTAAVVDVAMGGGVAGVP